MTPTRIFLAFRFHTNFYHSYRGDTPDELGFGKDIRIIRRILNVLDTFNAQDIPARGTWDIENYFSLQEIMPEHCPDIIASLQRRVAEGMDEVQVMSYNNGLISAHTAVEFDDAIERALTNAQGSGLADVFPSFAPIVRPQEMMYTPLHLKLYPAHGIDTLSLFYSAVPFNAFSNFTPLLPLAQRYNPLTLTYPGIEQTMTLIPAYNHGDVLDNLSLRRWLKRLRREQLNMDAPQDLLLLLDADADDDFWYGYDWPIVSTLLATARGLQGLIESVCDLPFLTFTTPGAYIKDHPPVATVTFGQDTADGSFDGFASWADKWSNHQLWTGIERARILALQTRHLMEIQPDEKTHKTALALLQSAYEARLKAMSTTHFGLSTPVMNRSRLYVAAELVHTATEDAGRAFNLVARTLQIPAPAPEVATFTLLDYTRGLSTDTVTYAPHPSRALVCLAFSVPPATALQLQDDQGSAIPTAQRACGQGEDTHTELLFVTDMAGGMRQDFHIHLNSGISAHAQVSNPVSADKGQLKNAWITLDFDGALNPVRLSYMGTPMMEGNFMRSAVNYAGHVTEVNHWSLVASDSLAGGLIGFIRVKGDSLLKIKGEPARLQVTREFMLTAELPYLYVRSQVTYPHTRSNHYNRNTARQLEQIYDGNWREVMPSELRPALLGSPDAPLRVWKHNYVDHVSYYDLNYGTFSQNADVDSFNNHVTHAWVAVSDREKGLLVAQTADVNACFAFCPMRLRSTPHGSRVLLNPFGSYHGKQLKYAAAFSGLGRFAALQMAGTLAPYAPSYNGHTEHIDLLLAPYAGDCPPESIRYDAEAFAYPYAVVSNSEIVQVPPHRTWAMPDTPSHEVGGG